MPLNSRKIRAQPHTEIGLILQENVDLLVEQWSARARDEEPHAQRVHHTVLQDDLRGFLRTLGQSLVASEDEEAGQHRLPAALHGEQRWKAGWSLTEVVRDFQILRIVIVDFLEQELDRRLAHYEVLAVGLALDEAISASVASYVADRERHLRQVQNEHIEELERAHKKLQVHAEALRQADRRKNEFLAILGHELRNPLAPVRNAIEVLKLKTPLDPEVQWARDIIDRQVQHMAHMIDDLLDIARITQGKLELQMQAVELAPLLQTCVEQVRPLSQARRQQLYVTLPPERIVLRADPVRLKQVVVNLLNNAVKYTDDGGQIWLTVARAGDEVAIKVRDNGLGIPPELLVDIFKPFVQEDRLHKRDRGGLGIGLALVQSLVDLHHGRVQATSAGRSQGSEFVVHLPAPRDALQPPAAGAAAPIPRPPKCRILVVDDNEDAARTLKLLLELFGHEVHLAFSGQFALELAARCRPEVVLLDIGLPQMDGLEVARSLRAMSKLDGVLLIALTGYAREEDRQRSQEAGFDAHLIKPLELASLNELLLNARMKS